jgi:hypothetical protein
MSKTQPPKPATQLKKEQQRLIKDALDDAEAIGRGKARDPRRVVKALREMRAIVHKKLGAVPEDMAQLVAQLESIMVSAAHHARPFIEEAEALLAAVKDADYPTVERYITEHPPSAAAIGFLVVVARDSYKSERGRRNALARDANYAKARSYVRDTWAHRQVDEYRSKPDFAAFLLSTVTAEYGVNVSQRTIEKWIPKGEAARQRGRAPES